MRYTLFIDESGSLSLNNNEKYFAIGGYLIINKNLSHRYAMKNLYKKINADREKYFNYFALKKGETEVKYSNLNLEGKQYALEKLSKLDGVFVAIVVDKENCHRLTNNDTNENYNYLVGELIKYIFEHCNHHGSIDFEELKIIYDDRSMKVKARNGLQAYLLEKLKIKRPIQKQFSCNFNVKAADSKVNHGVMVADFVAGVCKDDFSREKNDVGGILKIKYLSKFPFREFNKKIAPKEIINREIKTMEKVI